MAAFSGEQGYPSGCRLSRRSSDRQIEKSFDQIQKTNRLQGKLSGFSDERRTPAEICAAKTLQS
jgi:hypothetical protein